MANYYFDTSAMLKIYIEEDGTDRVLTLIDEDRDNRLFILELTLLDARSAIGIRERMGRISTDTANGALAQIDRDRTSLFTIQSISAPVMNEASRLIDNHPLRSLDALQLAGCILLSQAYRPPPIFVCADYDLCAAAAAERIATLNPLQPT